MSADRASRLYLAWTRVRDSLWFVPTVGVLVGTVVAVLAVRIPTPETTSELARVWLFGGGAAGARSMLGAIASSLITVTGVVFSVTIVALQLASSQFTPRVLGSFVADRVNQGVLGVFIGTFTYTLLVLRTIRSEADDRALFVPHIAVTIALVLLLVSIAALIVFINHSARSIQASVILDRETRRALRRVDVLFPERIGTSEAKQPPETIDETLRDRPEAFVLSTASGYLQAVHVEGLWVLDAGADDTPLLLRMEVDVGAFVLPGTRLATVWPASIVDDAFAAAVRGAFVLGAERTIEQDVDFGLVVIADIALRALSPGVNDPTTALQCIDRLTEILAALGTRVPPSQARRSADGSVHLQLRSTSFARALPIAFDQIRLFGAENPVIAARLLRALHELAAIVPERAYSTLRLQRDALLAQARRSVRDVEALREIERIGAIGLDRPAPSGT